MNPDVLQAESVHVQEEHWKQRDLLGVLERSLQLAVAAYLSGRPPEGLPGSAPAADADAGEWLDYFIGQGSLVFHAQLDLATTGGGTP